MFDRIAKMYSINHLTTVFSIAFFVSKGLGLALEPRATSVVDSNRADGQSPRPTSGPLASKAGLKRANEIFARSASPVGGVCGFIDRNANDPVWCPAGYGCGVSIAR